MLALACVGTIVSVLIPELRILVCVRFAAPPLFTIGAWRDHSPTALTLAPALALNAPMLLPVLAVLVVLLMTGVMLFAAASLCR